MMASSEWAFHARYHVPANDEATSGVSIANNRCKRLDEPSALFFIWGWRARLPDTRMVLHFVSRRIDLATGNSFMAKRRGRKSRLSVIPVADLQAELARRQRQLGSLIAEHNEVSRRLDAVRSEIEALGGTVNGTA